MTNQLFFGSYPWEISAQFHVNGSHESPNIRAEIGDFSKYPGKMLKIEKSHGKSIQVNRPGTLLDASISLPRW
jgi:hypothetical protein